MGDGARPQVRTLAPGEILEQPLRETVKILGPKVRFWICCPVVTSVAVHYSGTRTEPCVMHTDRAECPFCRRGWRAMPQHWLQVCAEPHGASIPEMLSLTEHAVGCDWHFSEPGTSLWLMSVDLWRVPCHPKGVMHAVVNAGPMATNLPERTDTLEILWRLWTARLRSERDGRKGSGGRNRDHGE